MLRSNSFILRPPPQGKRCCSVANRAEFVLLKTAMLVTGKKERGKWFQSRIKGNLSRKATTCTGVPLHRSGGYQRQMPKSQPRKSGACSKLLNGIKQENGNGHSLGSLSKGSLNMWGTFPFNQCSIRSTKIHPEMTAIRESILQYANLDSILEKATGPVPKRGRRAQPQ